jgi:hypothetical protein
LYDGRADLIIVVVIIVGLVHVSIQFEGYLNKSVLFGPIIKT